MSDLFDQPRTRARSGDRDTSHKAAAQIIPVRYTIRQQVEDFARRAGNCGFIDEQLIEAFPEKTPSTLRTRRSELGFENIVLDTGCRRLTSAGRETIVWQHRDFHNNPPPRKEPEVVMSRPQQIVILEAQKRALQIAMKEAIARPEQATSILTAALAAIN